MKQWKDLKIGDTIYNASGTASIIHGETSRSWLIGSKWHPDKVSKKYEPGTSIPDAWVADESEARELVWLREYRYQISYSVQSCKNPKVLRQIAELIEWKEPAK